MPRVGGDITHRIGRGTEQNGVDDTLVLERDLRRRRGHGEDDMEIRHRQQLRLSCFEPRGPRQALTLRAVSVAARVVSATNQSAIVALFDMSAERGCPAGLDRRHHPALDPAEMCIIPIKPNFAPFFIQPVEIM
jgi:hypothetical protein